MATELEQIRGMVETGAVLALVGIDPTQYLGVTDPLELKLMNDIATRVLDLRELERIDLSRRIRHEIAEMLGG